MTYVETLTKRLRNDVVFAAWVTYLVPHLQRRFPREDNQTLREYAMILAARRFPKALE